MEESKKESRLLGWFKRNFTVKTLVTNALIAALYAVITILCGPLSYVGGSLQLRLSELLNLLVFFNPMYSVGLTLGCLLANVMSMYGWPDIVFGTLATLISCLLIVLITKTIKNLLLSAFVPCVINGAVVPFIIWLYDSASISNVTTYWIFFGWTFLGELICIVAIGYPLFMLLAKKYKGFYKLIDATNSTNFKF